MNTWATPFQCKSVDDAGIIEGIAAGIGNVDRGGDRIMPGAFAKSIASRAGTPVPLLLCHDIKRPAGAWTEFKEKADGLHVKGRLTLSSRDGAEAYALVRDGALTGLSIDYLPTKEIYVGQVRELREMELLAVSLVPVPMNDRGKVTSVKAVTNIRDLEELLREGGLSGRKAKTAATAAWKAINDHNEEDTASAELAAILKASAARLGFA